MIRFGLLLALWAVPALAQTAPPRLTGLIVTPERRVALFQDEAGMVDPVEEGGSIAGYTVRTIRRDRAVVERDGRAVMLVPTPATGSGNRPPLDDGGVTFGLVVNPQRPAED